MIISYSGECVVAVAGFASASTTNVRSLFACKSQAFFVVFLAAQSGTEVVIASRGLESIGAFGEGTNARGEVFDLVSVAVCADTRAEPFVWVVLRWGEGLLAAAGCADSGFGCGKILGHRFSAKTALSGAVFAFQGSPASSFRQFGFPSRYGAASGK